MDDPQDIPLNSLKKTKDFCPSPILCALAVLREMLLLSFYFISLKHCIFMREVPMGNAKSVASLPIG
jgi:hypothetical protein